MSRFITAAAVIACTAALSACDSQTFEVDHQTKASTGITEVIVDIDIGAVVVKGTKETQASAHVEALWTDRETKPAVDFREEGSKLYVSANCNGIVPCRADIELSMPAGAILRADGEEADITAEGLKGKIFATTATGDIALDNVSGALDLTVRDGTIIGTDLLSTSAIASTEKGKIDLVFLAPLWNVDASTVRGDIKLTMPKLDYMVSAETGSGTVDIRVPQSSTSTRIVSASIAESGNILIAPLDATGGAM